MHTSKKMSNFNNLHSSSSLPHIDYRQFIPHTVSFATGAENVYCVDTIRSTRVDTTVSTQESADAVARAGRYDKISSKIFIDK